jgi:membrane protein DedA with SNARE-associated domain
MESYLPDLETMSHWLNQYGSITLFVLLALGIIALPVPEETLMVFAGILMKQGKLGFHSTILAAYAGSIMGITVSYILGKTVGNYLFHKYGSWIGITEKRLEQAHQWFEHYGKWTLVIGYFIPGIRHFTGFSAGTTGLEYHYFALFAYIGALLWVSTFLSIGYFFGHYWMDLLHDMEKMFHVNQYLFVVAVIALFAVFLYWKNKKD